MLRLFGILALGNMIIGDDRCCRHSAFPGSLFLLPALMLGGWIVLAVVGGILSLIGAIIGGVFSGLAFIASDVFSGSGIVLGIVLGLAAFWVFRNRNIRKTAGTEEE